MIEQPADIFAGQVAFQRPRRVGVAEHRREVRHVRIHHALVGQRLREIDRRPSTVTSMPPSTCRFEAGRGDDDVGLQFAAGLQPDAGLGEGLDLVGDDRRLACRIARNKSPSGTRHSRWSHGL